MIAVCLFISAFMISQSLKSISPETRTAPQKPSAAYEIPSCAYVDKTDWANDSKPESARRFAKEVLEEEKNSNQPLDKREQAKAALTELFESIKTENTPIIVERVVADIDENVVAIVRKFKDAFKSITAQREIKKKLRSILWINYQIKDQEVFDKAYQYIEMYY